MLQVCVATFLGLLASGKSTFARKIFDSCRTGLINSNIIYVCFDDIIKIDYKDQECLENGSFNTHQRIGFSYKKSRKLLLESVDSLFSDLKNGSNSTNSFCLNSENSFFSSLNSNLLVILDDNFYYKSMRQEIVRICENFEFSHFSVFFDCNESTVISRNNSRQNPIPEFVVKRMIEIFERPKIDSEVLVLNSSQSFTLNKFIKIHQLALENPKKKKVVQTISRSPVPNSIIHQIDLNLRNEISLIIKSHKETSIDMKILPQLLNSKRKELLESLRNSTLSIPEDLNDLRTRLLEVLEEI